MATYINPRYPFFKFYVNEIPYRFRGGVFDVDENVEEAQKADVVARLEQLVNDPKNANGVQREETFTSPYKCDVCKKGFQSQASLWGHAGAHKTKAEIESESVKEGSGESRLPL